jgi:hypothetical protein
MREDEERRDSAQQEKPSRDELLALLRRANDALEASEHHWRRRWRTRAEGTARGIRRLAPATGSA